MTLVYNLIRIEDIINDGFTLELPENTIEIINNISAIVGSATYVKTPVFHKKSKNEKKRSSEPPVPRPVVEKTKFEEYCGRIATNFNKLTEKNFSKLEKEIIDDMSVIVDELSENEFNTIVNRLFEAATLNRYSSKCYANISISLMSRWDDIKSIFYNNINTYLDTFNNIESVSPDKDYEKFCILNSINEKRRATGLFLVSLFHSKLFTMDGLTDIIVNLTDLLYKLVKEDEHQSMKMQLTRVIDYLDYLPITTITIEGIEADDTMAYLTKQVMKTSNIVLMSTDKDFLQLVNHRVSVWSPTKKKMYDPPKVLEDYGIPSHNFAVYRSIDGDKSDNINGVRGWGLKTIQKKLPLLLEDKILNIDDIIKEDEKLKENEEILRRNYRLMQLEEVDISTSAKTKILDKIREPINRLNKMQFQKKFIEDRLFATLPNMESWLVQCFAKLNQMAEGTYGKKEKV